MFWSIKEYQIEQDLTGKVALITGASSGVGKVSAYKLAEKGCHVILATRSYSKTEPIIKDIIEKTGNKNVEFVEFIADDLESVKKCAQEFKAKNLPLHILMNNAGLAGIGGVSKQGFQHTFAVNYLSHFLLTDLLLPVLKSSSPSRIVNVSSTGHRTGRLYDFESLKSPDQATLDRVYLQNYADSKLAQAMHARKLSQLLQGTGVSTYSLHPGVVATDIWKVFPGFVQPVMKWFMITEEQGAMTQLYCATEPKLQNTSGKYYDNCQEAKYNPFIDVQEHIDLLWEKSMEFIKSFQ
jgi:NAD(P)-dependent dehydrogenase (short-subunit alcohol dehydrogenase family)